MLKAIKPMMSKDDYETCTDIISTKIVATDEYPVFEQRQAWRKEINELEAEIAQEEPESNQF